MIQNISLLGVKVSRVNPGLAYDQIVRWIKNKERSFVCIAPVSTLVDAQKDIKYREVINKADMVTPDGVPVVWLAHLKGAKETTRTYGPDLMRMICNNGQDIGLRHFFYGASDETLLQLQNYLRFDYPKIQIVGAYAPPFSPKIDILRAEVIKLINDSKADIIWVGLGSPKQDFWMHINRPLLNVPVMVGAGAAFDFIAKVKPEAPRWIQNLALGWLFRLCCEPKRLWRRYLIGNILFIYYILKDFFRNNHDS